jgi:hypothetical protein
MAKKVIRHSHRRVHHRTVRAKPANDTLVVVRGWMFVVAFALMLGVGAIVGTFFNQMLNSSIPTVAGAQIQK